MRPLGVLIADDDALLRASVVAALRERDGWLPLEAADGAEATRIGLQLQPAVALLDLHMPRLGGDAVAQTLRQLRPAMRIALHSSDPHGLRDRGRELGVTVFDKLDLEAMVAWTAAQLRSCAAVQLEEPSRRVMQLARSVELACAICSYGIVTRRPPGRCPMCGGLATWAS